MSIEKGAAPQAECAPREAQPIGKVSKSGNVVWLSTPQPGFIYATPTPERAQTISDAMMDLVDRLGSEASEVDPRAWKHLLVYAPERADAEKESGK
jgi:hypothetical protein